METAQAITHMRAGSILPGKNPRTYFDPIKMQEMDDSVRVHGVIQPILIRPTENGFEKVVGGRRLQSAIRVLGEDYEIPVLVKAMTDEEAEDVALIENVIRADMSPAEEAEAAAKILGRCEGNRDEAAKRLGWTRTMLDKRLSLMNCSSGVLAALRERKIQLGHAELLAAAPKDKQEAVIEKLLSAPSMPTVAQFKTQLESISKSLAVAIFKLDECAGCHHNSGNQQQMFAEAIQSGHCTNGACYDKKMMVALEATKKSLEDEYPRVQIVNPGENFTTIKLVAEGATGVGEEQAKACKACKNYGAAISNIPGKIGNVYKGQCFDAECNTGKVTARLKAEKAAAAPKDAPANAKAGVAKAPEQSGAAKAKPAVTTVQDSGRVLEYRVTFWRSALKKELFADPRENLSMLIGIMMTRGGSHVSSTKLSSVFEKLSGYSLSSSTHVGQAAALVSSADDKVRDQMLSGIVITMTENIEKNHLGEMLEFLQVDLSKHFKLNADFLNLLTKSEIEVIADEIGLKAALGEKYSKVMGGKKDEIVKAMLAVEGFDYAGKIPKVLQHVIA